MARNGIKRRIYDEVLADGVRLHTLFDTGAQNSYITRVAADRCGLKREKVNAPLRTGLGGKKRLLREVVVLQGKLHRFPVLLEAFVVDDLDRGDDGTDIDLLFGILAMERWGVDPDVPRKRIDLTHFKREFVEYSA